MEITAMLVHLLFFSSGLLIFCTTSIPEAQGRYRQPMLFFLHREKLYHKKNPGAIAKINFYAPIRKIMRFSSPLAK
jgi:hypothetical protein